MTVWSGGNAYNQPLDADGTIAITGGSAGMGMNLSTTQAYVTFGSAGISGMGNMGGQPKSDSKVSGNFQPSDDFRPGDMTSNNSMSSGGSAPSDGFGASLISAGSIMTILDPSGSTAYSGEAACRAAFVFFSSADLNTDKTYTLSAGSISAATATAQAGTSTAQKGSSPAAIHRPCPAATTAPVTQYNQSVPVKNWCQKKQLVSGNMPDTNCLLTATPVRRLRGCTADRFF